MKNELDRSQIPQPADPRPFNFPEFERFKLPNGLEVLVAGHRELPLVSFNLCIKSSALCDPPKKEGMANLLAELLTEGTASRNSLQIANELESIGALYGTHADWNAIYGEVSSLKRYSEKALEIFSDLIKNSVFADNELERVRHELLTERMRSVDSPSKLVNERFINLLYGDQRYGMPVEGTDEALKSISRKDILDFYKKNIIPQNATLIVVGDMTVDEARELILKYFSDWPQFRPPRKQEIKNWEIKETNIALIHKKGSVQSELRIGHLGIERDNPDFFAVTMMNEILGGYFLSRINMNLREEHGYTYGASSGFSYRVGRGPFYVAASVHSQFTAASVIEVVKEIKKMRDTEITAEELEHARGHMIGMFPVAFETADQLAMGLANIVVFNLADDYYRTYREKIAEISADDIRNAAQKYLTPDNLQIVICGDRNEVEQSLRDLYPLTVYDVQGNVID